MKKTAEIYQEAAQVAALLRKRDNFLVAAHASPDGDAVGATVAVGRLLERLGKRFALYNASPLPVRYAWLALPGPWHTELDRLPFTPETAIILDCGDAARTGPELARLLTKLPSINLDHHLGNPLFGTLANWVEPEFAATGQLAAEVARAAGVRMDGELAAALCLALVADTGSFSFANTTGNVFRLMAELADNGLRVDEVRDHMDKQWTLHKSRLWGALFARLELRLEGRLLLVPVRKRDFEEFGASPEDLEGFVEFLRRHKGVEIAALLREDAPDRCKLSLRSSGDLDIRALALRFGGGGHKNAAGATLLETPEQALQSVERAARELLDGAA